MLYYRFSFVISKKEINLLHINLSYLYYDEYKSKIITDYTMVSSVSDTTSFFFEKQSLKYKEKTCTSCSFSYEYNDICPTFWVSS